MLAHGAHGKAVLCWDQMDEIPEPVAAALMVLDKERTETGVRQVCPILFADSAEIPPAQEILERWDLVRKEGFDIPAAYGQIVQRGERRAFQPELPVEALWAVKVYGVLGKDGENRTLRTEMDSMLSEARVDTTAWRQELAGYWEALDSASRAYQADIFEAAEQKRFDSKG